MYGVEKKQLEGNAYSMGFAPKNDWNKSEWTTNIPTKSCFPCDKSPWTENRASQKEDRLKKILN